MADERINIVVTEDGSRIVQRSLEGIGESARKGQEGVNLLKQTLANVGVGVGLFSTVRAIADFSEAIAGLRAASTATAPEFDQLRASTIQLGATTETTAAQVVQAHTLMTKAGFTVNQQLQMINGTIELATIGHVDLTTAVDSVTHALKDFNLGADQSAHVIDALARTVTTSSANLQSLGGALKFIGPVAASAHVSIEEISASLGVLSNAGLEAYRAGSGLRQMLTTLENPSDAARKVLMELGISANQVKVSQVGLTGALEVLKNAGIDATKAMQLFGGMNDRTFEILSHSIPQLKQMTDAMRDSGGYATKTAAIMDDNLGGALKRLRSAANAAQIAIGELGGANSILKTTVDGLTTAIRFLAEHTAILDGALAVMAIASLPRLVSLLTLLVGSTGLWGIALGAAVGSLISFSNEIKLSTDSTTTLADLGQAAFERIKTSGQMLIDFFRDEFSGITTVFDGVSFSVEGLIRLTAKGLDGWISIWRGALVAIGAALASFGPMLQDLATQWMNDLLNIVNTGLHKVLQAVTIVWRQLPGGIGKGIQEAVNQAVIPQLQNSAEGAAASFGEHIATGFSKGFNQVTLFEDSVNEMFDRADQIATERLAKQAQVTGQGLPGTPGGAAPTPESDPVQRLSQLHAGIDSGMQKIGQTIHQYGTQMEVTLTHAFSSAEDALVSFTTTGKVNFKGMVDAMLGDLTRLAFRMGLNSLFPEGSSLFGGARAEGGPVEAGKAYLVGERGRPEIYVPSAPGQIVPIPVSAPAKAQEPPKVTIIQVNSMDAALAAMRSSEGQRIIVNAGGRQR